MELLKRRPPTFFITIAACALALSMGGCDAFLAKNTEGVLTPKEFYKTPEDLQAAVAAAWSPVTSQNKWNSISSIFFINPLMGGDDRTTERARTVRAHTDRLSALPTSKFLQSVWTDIYRAIYRANTLLANLGASPVEQVIKDQAAAQVRFLRGWLYFHLVRLFGPVPLTVTPEPDPDAKRTPVAKVYDQIVKDLKFAEAHLPGHWDGAPGKPNKWAAKAMLARVYLTMAGWPLHDEGKYDLARDNFLEVMNSGQYRLLDDFAALWQIENNWNDELVFAIAYCRPCNMGNSLIGSPTAPLVEGGTGATFAEIHFFRDFPEGHRKEATFYTVFKVSTDSSVHWTDSPLGHPYYAKWRSGTTYGGDGPQARHSSRTAPIIRYAHVLLGFAEAQAMADGGPSARAYEAVNKVRDRAGLPDLTPGLGMIAFRDSVIRERAWEFAGEFSRWFDLVRTEKVAEAMVDKAPGDMKPLRNIQTLPKKHYYWLPIPHKEILLNPDWKQNPGYRR